MLQLIKDDFDFICISATKVIKNCEPRIEISLNNYQEPVGTPTEAEKGGVLIYVKKGINFEPREDLNIYKERQLESYFIEVMDGEKQINRSCSLSPPLHE